MKPDITAPGVGVYAASTGGYDAYSYQSGTSLASPIAAGAAALLLSARPELTPVQVRDAIRASADPARILNPTSFPNNFTGWGYLDALSAVAGAGPVYSNRPEVAAAADGAVISTGVLSDSGVNPDSVLLRYWDDGDANALADTLRMNLDSTFLFPGSGRYSATIPPHPVGARVAFVISAVDGAGRSYTSPSPYFHDRWILSYGAGEVEAPAVIPALLRLLELSESVQRRHEHRLRPPGRRAGEHFRHNVSATRAVPFTGTSMPACTTHGLRGLPVWGRVDGPTCTASSHCPG